MADDTKKTEDKKLVISVEEIFADSNSMESLSGKIPTRDKRAVLEVKNTMPSIPDRNPDKGGNDK